MSDLATNGGHLILKDGHLLKGDCSCCSSFSPCTDCGSSSQNSVTIVTSPPCPSAGIDGTWPFSIFVSGTPCGWLWNLNNPFQFSISYDNGYTAGFQTPFGTVFTGIITSFSCNKSTGKIIGSIVFNGVDVGCGSITNITVTV